MLFNVKSNQHSKYKSQEVLHEKSKRTTKGEKARYTYLEK
jgi:hypothetical protein